MRPHPDSCTARDRLRTFFRRNLGRSGYVSGGKWECALERKSLQ